MADPATKIDADSGASDAVSPVRPGERLGEYEIRRLIAVGGMGIVYLARQSALERDVALKVLRTAFAIQPGFVQRFRHEASSAASLDHPNIVKIFGVGEERGVHFFAMEFVEGESLKHLIRRRGALPAGEAVAIVLKVADALECAAEHSLVHRDLKPENILVTLKQRVKVTDFGLAKSLAVESGLSDPGKILGTVHYMAPEQALGRPVDGRSDLYSLGAVCFEMLAGRPPFSGDHPSAILYQHIHEAPPALETLNRSLPPAVARLVERLLAKDPEDRPASAADLVSELEALREEYGLRLPGRDSERIPRPHPEKGRRFVLLVDDDADIRLACRPALEAMGLEVLEAGDGVTALDLWRGRRPDVILLDLQLPRLGGMAVLEEKVQSSLGGTVILMSTVADEPLIRSAAAHGVQSYLLKPFPTALLQERLRRFAEPGPVRDSQA